MTPELLHVLDAEGQADPAKDPGLDSALLLKLYDSRGLGDADAKISVCVERDAGAVH